MDRLRLLPLLLVLLASCMPPEWGADMILHPQRVAVQGTPVLPHDDVSFEGEGGVTLKGWLFKASGQRRGLLVYLHGISSNRTGGIGLAQRFVPQGWDVLAYDQRGHGESGGSTCSYGVFEKRDVSRALDAVHADSAILIGSSLGASVALQAAAQDARVRGVIAQSPFADLRLVAHDRAPFFATERQIEDAFALVRKQGGYSVDDASVLKAAPSIHVPVLLIHGAADTETTPEHSRRIYALLQEPRQLVLVDGATHNNTLAGGAIWDTIEQWVAARAH